MNTTLTCKESDQNKKHQNANNFKPPTLNCTYPFSQNTIDIVAEQYDPRKIRFKLRKLNCNLSQPGMKTKHYGNGASKIETRKVN